MELFRNIYAFILHIFDDIDFFTVILFVLFIVPLIKAFLSLDW